MTDPSYRATSADPKIPWWFLPLVICVAFLARLPGLGDGLWYDEIETLVTYVRRPLPELITTFDSQNQHLLYSVLARVSVLILGESAAALRLPAVLLGLASIWAFFRFARRVTTPVEAMFGTIALAVSYHHVWFSQNARGYTGLLFFSILATDAFHRLLTDPRAGQRTVVAYAVAVALACYTHATAVLVAVGHAAIFLVVLPSRLRRSDHAWLPALGLVGAAVLTLVLYGPVLTQLPGTLAGSSPHAAQTDWQNPLWAVAELARGLARALPGGSALVALSLGALVMGIGWWSFAARDRQLAALLVVPGVLTAAAVAALGHNLWPRFFFFSAGFAILIAVRGGFSLMAMLLGRRGPKVAIAGATLALVASAITVPRAWAPKQDFGGALDYVERSRRDGDAVVTVDLTNYPYDRYYNRKWAIIPSADSLERVEQAHQRTWLLFTFPVRLAAVQPDVWQRLSARYDTAAVYPGTVGGGAVVVMLSRDKDPTS